MLKKGIVGKYVDAVNNHDIEAINELMSDDFLFIDSSGNRLEGKGNMLQAWEKYFTFFPDYSMLIEEVFTRNDTFILIGSAKGTYCPYGNFDPADNWEVPAVWKVEFKNDQISLWQVYADNTLVFQVINRYPGLGLLT